MDSKIKELKKKFNKMEESILDIPHNDYCKDILDEKDKIKENVKSQILSTLKNWKDQINFDFNIEKVHLKGSLLSRRYNDTSDLDVTIYTNMSKEQVDSIIDILPKGLNIENTQHPLDFYVLGEGEKTPEKNLDNIYDLLNDKWVKRTPEYENEIPLDYTIQVCNFFINGCRIALSNFENDKILYEYYRQLNPDTQDIAKDELLKILEDKRRDLKADFDALRVALHMISSFRQEAYDNDSFDIALEIKSKNPHVTLNETFAKLLEKFGIRDALRDAVKECAGLIDSEGLLQEEVNASAFAGMVPDNMVKIEEEPLRESASKVAAFCFGRYNIPTIGHLLLWKTLSDTNADAKFIYTSHTQDKKRNPLDYITKSLIIKKCINDYNLNAQFVESSARTFIDVLVDIWDKGYDKIIIIAGGDRIEELLALADKYNNIPNKEGKAYFFKSIEGINSGLRDPDSDSVEGISGTKMREFVKKNDFENFSAFFPIKDKDITLNIFKEAKSILN